jgi:hypothetical protein
VSPDGSQCLLRRLAGSPIPHMNLCDRFMIPTHEPFLRHLDQ